jgi:hypothetical protein
MWIKAEEKIKTTTKVRVTNIHNKKDCKLDIVRCSRCNNLGHPTRHLNTAKNAHIDLLHLTPETRFHAFETVYHSCFAENKDIGRNIFCYLKEITVGVNEVYLTIRLKSDREVPPEFVKERQREAEAWELWTSGYDDPYNQGFQDD